MTSLFPRHLVAPYTLSLSETMEGEVASQKRKTLFDRQSRALGVSGLILILVVGGGLIKGQGRQYSQTRRMVVLGLERMGLRDAKGVQHLTRGGSQHRQEGGPNIDKRGVLTSTRGGSQHPTPWFLKLTFRISSPFQIALNVISFSISTSTPQQLFH